MYNYSSKQAEVFINNPEQSLNSKKTEIIRRFYRKLEQKNEGIIRCVQKCPPEFNNWQNNAIIKRSKFVEKLKGYANNCIFKTLRDTVSYRN